MIYSHNGVRRTPVGYSQAYMSVCLSFCLSISLSGHPRLFLAIIRVARNYAHRMGLQATVSTPLSGTIICPSLNPSGIL